MTKYYLYTCNALAPFDRLKDAKEKAREMLLESGAPEKLEIFQPVAILRRGEIPITCEDLIPPPPPKRGRPRKPAPAKTTQTNIQPEKWPATVDVVIESSVAPEQPDPDGLFRGRGFSRVGVGESMEALSGR